MPVANLADSIAACERLGGRVVNRHSKTQCVIQDPAGAVMVIYEEQKSP